jgi:hypothetical protein
MIMCVTSGELCLPVLTNKPECVLLAIEVIVENPGLQLDENPCTLSTKVKATVSLYCQVEQLRDIADQ